MIFDFDGLVLDTETPELQSWHEIYKFHGLELSKNDWVKRIGLPEIHFDPYLHLQKLCGYPIDIESTRQKRRMINKKLNDKQELLPGVLECLNEAMVKGFKTAIASSSDHNWVDSHLKRLGIIDYFNQIICEEDTNSHKPFPDPYVKALELLEVGSKNAVALEDSPNGVAAAKAAGLFCIAIPNEVTKNLDLTEADIIIESLEKYPLERIEKHFNR